MPRPRCAGRRATSARIGPAHWSHRGAEREGFEPSRELAPPTRLAGECLQPLGHLSGAGNITGGAVRLVPVPDQSPARYEGIFAEVEAPFAFVDLDAMRANAEEMLGRAGSKPIR